MQRQNGHGIHSHEAQLPVGRPNESRGFGRAATFSALGRNSFPEARRISNAAFPNDFQYFQKGGLKSLLKEPGADRFSFMIVNSMTGRPSGYCVAYYKPLDTKLLDTRRHDTKRHDTTSLYVDHFAISPEDQGNGFGLQGLGELLRRVEEDGQIDKLDMHVRKATAYRAIMDHQDIIRSAGYEVEDHGEDEDESPYELYEGRFAFEGDATHRLVFRRLPDLVR